MAILGAMISIERESLDVQYSIGYYWDEISARCEEKIGVWYEQQKTKTKKKRRWRT